MPTQTRENILLALQDVLNEDGAAAVTLEAVAEKAGVSKGGLLYHFPSKASLYLGLVERLDELSQKEIASAAASKSRAKWYLETSIPQPNESNLSRAVLAVLRSADGASDELLAKIQTVYSSWSQLVQQEVSDQVRADAITLVGDGVYFNYLLGLKVPETKRLERLYTWLLDH